MVNLLRDNIKDFVFGLIDGENGDEIGRVGRF